MANTPTKMIVDCATGERKEIPLSAEEIAQREAIAQRLLAEEQAEAEAQAQKEADRLSAIEKLTALGLTESEALALAGN